jgi:hypothetical protein
VAERKRKKNSLSHGVLPLALHLKKKRSILKAARLAEGSEEEENENERRRRKRKRHVLVIGRGGL